MLAILLTGIRGGFQTFPINKSWAYFSKHNTLNVAAVNSMWNFMELVFTKEEIIQNPYQYFPADEALKIVEQTHNSLIDTTTKILQNPRPNIIMIILESWSGDIIEPLGGENNVSPGFSELCKEGLLFTNFYSTGFRTEQCLAALISGFPSQPTTTIIRKFGKFDKLPSIVKVLSSNGYNSSYYYGGDLYFANAESYLEFAGFDKIIGENDFEFKKRTRWGAFDEELFNFCIQDMKITQEPFFNIIMTTTSHEPFDAPVNEGFEGDDLPQLYRNTIHYTDRCLGQYITKAKEQALYENTLFIIVSDHAHKYPLNRSHNHPERHRIPFLLYGDVLKEEFRGKENTRVGSHIDIPATILAQLDIKHETFFWSKNLFNKFKPAFAFYAFDEGFGWINERQTLVFDHKLNKVVIKKNNNIAGKDNDTYLKQGKAYLQILLQEYIDFNN
ncbi:MAG: LTA synthase family protein [Bacteroidota bacterium]